MYTQTQLEAIRIFGRKELTFGCVLELKEKEDGDVNYFYVCKSDFDGDTVFVKTKEKGYEDCTLEFYRSEYEILGHEPHLEDVFRVAEENKLEYEIMAKPDGHELYIYHSKIFHVHYSPTLPLLEQSESTLQQLISLFK